MPIDTTPFTAEPYDPCAALTALRPVYFDLLLNPAVKVVKFRDRTVEYGGSNLKEIAALMAQLESDCAAKTGKTARRFAITAGGRTGCRGAF